MRNRKLARLRKLLLKMPVSERRAIILRAKFELIRGGRYGEAKPDAR
jgi:hypothetical protein